MRDWRLVARSIFIGDVHGCLVELDALLSRLAPADGDRFYFVGDLVDRGPDQAGAVRRVRELVERFPGSAVVMGNHEDTVLRVRARGLPGGPGLDQLSADGWAFLGAMPLYLHVPACGAVVVHAGFFPAFFDKHVALGALSPTWRTDKGKRPERLRRFLRVRRIDDRGEMVALGDTRAVEHWSSRYDGREGFCVFGHDPQLDPPEPLRRAHALGIDTGCVFGGRLTAAVVPDGTSAAAASFVSVPAVATYADPRRPIEDEA